jgi:cystathionine beta-lyase/cystathionine gamma-synthase
MKKETRVTHQPVVRLPAGNRAVVEPVYRSVKFTFPSIDDSMSPTAKAEGFDYTRDSNPTTRQLELLCAELQERDDALAVATGMASIWLALLGNLSAGDRVVIFLESYRPTRIAVRKILPRFGIDFVLLGIHDIAAIEREFSDAETKAVLFESPTNPMLEVPDMQRLLDLAATHAVTTVLDNTFAGLHNHGQYAVDYYVHSLTKYANGHGDVMGGIVIAAKEKLRPLRPLAVNMGSTLDPGAAYLILRGMKTYYLRYERHCANALAVAKFLSGRPEVERLRYPGLPEDAGHALARRQMHDFGGIVVFDLKADQARTRRFIDALELFVTTASLGSTDSLVSPVKLYMGSDLSADELARSNISDATVRLAVGIEHADDLIADLEQALNNAFA